ncbi:hypothetical protein IAG41_15950 [Sphingomonas sp. JC676]|uniref:hypothetical protein n=1 Tax=Sphingomonas sp. JC676 TaxID=2768065 RepID=UPI001657AF0F|nr:hypothetical protein [Sphingomonas sp. JC676]MBC9033886.1 hypothetical protein [Sphingomonas sp. JC676]
MTVEKEQVDEGKPGQADLQPDQATGGEDESSTEKNGDDSHLHDDQKAPSFGD